MSTKNYVKEIAENAEIAYNKYIQKELKKEREEIIRDCDRIVVTKELYHFLTDDNIWNYFQFPERMLEFLAKSDKDLLITLVDESFFVDQENVNLHNALAISEFIKDYYISNTTCW